jgi:hypothetical protein
MSGCLSSPFLRPPSPNRLLLAGPTPSRQMERDQKPRQRRHLPHFATVTVLAFAESSFRIRDRLAVSPFVKRAANGRVTDSGFKKKL